MPASEARCILRTSFYGGQLLGELRAQRDVSVVGRAGAATGSVLNRLILTLRVAGVALQQVAYTLGGIVSLQRRRDRLIEFAAIGVLLGLLGHQRYGRDAATTNINFFNCFSLLANCLR